MKRVIITIAVLAIAGAVSASAQNTKSQNDTTIVNSGNIKWDKVTYIADNAKVENKTEYVCVIDGEAHHTNKTSYERAKLAERFKARPIVARITNKSNPKGRIVVL